MTNDGLYFGKHWEPGAVVVTTVKLDGVHDCGEDTCAQLDGCCRHNGHCDCYESVASEDDDECAWCGGETDENGMCKGER